MSLTLQISELNTLMKNFYTLTGIRIVLFDENYKEILSYPEECIPFCAHMRKNENFYKECQRSDKISFDECRKKQALTMQQCHAGLVEVTAPIMDGGTIIGYIMFGQIRDIKSKKDFMSRLSSTCGIYENFINTEDKIERIKYKSGKQLVAAANILEACTSYILLRDLVKPSRIVLFNNIESYISDNLDKDITVESLCREFRISRTRLYESVKPYVNGGIASYVLRKRLLKAKEFLKDTDISITKIAGKVGYSDYNYFLRCFKKSFGISAKKYRELHR